MIQVASRKRNQPAPPRVVFEALSEPNQDPSREWLQLLPDEQWPMVVEAVEPDVVVWSSLWTGRPDARVRFDLPRDSCGYGTDLRWTLFVDEPTPDAAIIGRMRHRINVLINANLRYSFGQ